MRDGSNVRTKVAQYFVNKKHEELRSRKATLHNHDLSLLQYLPPFPADESAEEQLVSDSESSVEPSVEPPAELPPFFPPTHHVPWEDMLERYKKIQPVLPEAWPVVPPWYRVAIIGAGVAGLRTAMLLQYMRIPYKIFEASDRPGGRVFTYQFASRPEENPQGKHDYYDVGAMRFPDNDANQATFKLFEELGIHDKVIPYVMSIGENIRLYNDIKTTAAVSITKGDHFNDGIPRRGIVPQEYVDKECTDLHGNQVFGVDACTAAAFDPIRKALIEDFDKGWEELMSYDWASTRSYLMREKPQYPSSVVHWMETRNSGTSGFDRAFSEDILDSLEFDDPTKDVQWRCLEGGTHILIDAMLGKLTTQPFYNHRVTSVEMLPLSLPDYFPEGPGWPRWARSRDFPLMKVNVSGEAEEYFTHVVSTTTFGSLRAVDTSRVPMTYKQRQAIRCLGYGPAVKVAIKFKARWWEQAGIDQRGGSSYTDRQCRVVVHPSYGLGESGPGVLMVTYNWDQDASRFGALIQNPDWSEQLDPGRTPPRSEKVLLEQIYGDLAALYGVSVEWLQDQTLDYHAYDWYHNPYTMGAFAHFTPGQFATLFPDIVHPAGYGRFHFAGEVASHHHAWIAGALDSARRVVDEIVRWDFRSSIPIFGSEYGRSLVFSDDSVAEAHFLRGLLSRELEKDGFD